MVDAGTVTGFYNTGEGFSLTKNTTRKSQDL